MIYPIFTQVYDLPPTLYSIMESIVNYGKEKNEKIVDLATNARTTIFDFDYSSMALSCTGKKNIAKSPDETLQNHPMKHCKIAR